MKTTTRDLTREQEAAVDDLATTFASVEVRPPSRFGTVRLTCWDHTPDESIHGARALVDHVLPAAEYYCMRDGALKRVMAR